MNNTDSHLIQCSNKGEFSELINNIVCTEKQLKEVQSSLNLKEKEC